MPLRPGSGAFSARAGQCWPLAEVQSSSHHYHDLRDSQYHRCPAHPVGMQTGLEFVLLNNSDSSGMMSMIILLLKKQELYAQNSEQMVSVWYPALSVSPVTHNAANGRKGTRGIFPGDSRCSRRKTSALVPKFTRHSAANQSEHCNFCSFIFVLGRWLSHPLAETTARKRLSFIYGVSHHVWGTTVSKMSIVGVVQFQQSLTLVFFPSTLRGHEKRERYHVAWTSKVSTDDPLMAVKISQKISSPHTSSNIL